MLISIIRIFAYFIIGWIIGYLFQRYRWRKEAESQIEEEINRGIRDEYPDNTKGKKKYRRNKNGGI